MPSPAPRVASAPVKSSSSSGSDINAKLRALLPHNDVNPSQYSEHERVALNSSMEPTPPPEVLAQTKYIYSERGTGSDALVRMWVTSVHRSGPALICEGWMLRYPANSQPAYKQGTATNNVQGGINVTVFGGTTTGLLPPIIEEHATTSCLQRELTPYAPSPVSSP